MTPKDVVRKWWNGLTLEQRRAEARNLLGYDDPWDPWDVEWEDLSPIGQQMKIHMLYDERLEGKRRLHP